MTNDSPITLEFKLGELAAFPNSQRYETDDNNRVIFLQKTAILHAAHVKNSKTVLDKNYGHRFIVFIELNKTGAQILADMTESNIGKVIAVLVDDELVIAPIINSAITQGRFVISGFSSTEEAVALHHKIQQAIK